MSKILLVMFFVSTPFVKEVPDPIVMNLKFDTIEQCRKHVKDKGLEERKEYKDGIGGPTYYVECMNEDID